MSDDRTEQAVQRIEAALARIAKVADTQRETPLAISSLVNQHETLRESVSNNLKELDSLIERLEK